MVPLSEPAAEFLKRLRRKSGDHASDTTDEADGAAAEIYRPDQVCIADIPGLVEGAHLNIGLGVRKTHAEFCIKNYAFYIKNDEFYIKNDAFCIKNDAFCIKNDDFCEKHEFLRHVERSAGLVYVVDASAEAPWEELNVLRSELEAYQPGLSGELYH